MDADYHGPSDVLCEAINGMLPIDARKDALAILYDIPVTDAQAKWRVRGLGLVLNTAQKLWQLENSFNTNKPISSSEMRNELLGMSLALKEFVGRMKKLSWTTRSYIISMCDVDPSIPSNRKRMDLWDEAEADDMFCVPWDNNGNSISVNKLDCLVDLLGDLVYESDKYVKKYPGMQSVFEKPPADLDIFYSCASLLVYRGRNLDYLRNIAELVYEQATGTPPAGYWGKRQEEQARRRIKHTPQ